jgi:hypothetical protein
MPGSLEFVPVQRCGSLAEAEVLASLLRAAGLGVEVRGSALVGLDAPEFEVCVQVRNVARARAAIAERGARGQPGNVALCPRCSEESPANFETCWSCGATIPLSPG